MKRLLLSRPVSLLANLAFGFALPLQTPAQAPSQRPGPTTTRTLHFQQGKAQKSYTLTLPAGFDVNVAASNLRRVRFFAQAPDGRLFATGMFNLADNSQGVIYLLDGWNPQTHTFAHVTPFLSHLRNPNNLAFWTDPATGQSWLYVPLTDRLVRFRYNPGDLHPQSPPETLIRFPDYGLNYKYGGWHLTRTVAIATLHGRTRIFVAAGSSCNYCQEREVARASVIAMDPDGSHQQLVAQGLRNAVDLRFVPDLDGGSLFATNMGDDHLGDLLPEDTFFELDSNNHPGPISSPVPNFGWPTCYFAHGQPTHDTTPLPNMPDDPNAIADRPSAVAQTALPGDSVYGRQANVAAAGTNLTAGGGNTSAPDPNASLGAAPKPLAECSKVPAAYTTFAAHSSPLGLAFFGPENPRLHGSFLVALHGASHPHIGTGYRLVRFTPADRTPRDWLTGFLTHTGAQPKVHGRPCGLLRVAPDEFLLTDDYNGLILDVHPTP